MKPKQLKSLLAVILACLLLFSASCSRPAGEAKDDSEWANRDTWLTSGTASEQGYYYLQENHFLSFF